MDVVRIDVVSFCVALKNDTRMIVGQNISITIEGDILCSIGNLDRQAFILTRECLNRNDLASNSQEAFPVTSYCSIRCDERRSSRKVCNDVSKVLLDLD